MILAQLALILVSVLRHVLVRVAVHSLVVGRRIDKLVRLLLLWLDNLLLHAIVCLAFPVDLWRRRLLLLLRLLDALMPTHLRRRCRLLLLLLLLLRLVRHLRQLEYFAAHELHGVTKELVVLHVDLVDHFQILLKVLGLRLQLVDELWTLETLLDVRLADRLAA